MSITIIQKEKNTTNEKEIKLINTKKLEIKKNEIIYCLEISLTSEKDSLFINVYDNEKSFINYSANYKLADLAKLSKMFLIYDNIESVYDLIIDIFQKNNAFIAEIEQKKELKLSLKMKLPNGNEQEVKLSLIHQKPQGESSIAMLSSKINDLTEEISELKVENKKMHKLIQSYLTTYTFDDLVFKSFGSYARELFPLKDKKHYSERTFLANLYFSKFQLLYDPKKNGSEIKDIISHLNKKKNLYVTFELNSEENREGKTLAFTAKFGIFFDELIEFKDQDYNLKNKKYFTIIFDETYNFGAYFLDFSEKGGYCPDLLVKFRIKENLAEASLHPKGDDNDVTYFTFKNDFLSNGVNMKQNGKVAIGKLKDLKVYQKLSEDEL